MTIFHDRSFLQIVKRSSLNLDFVFFSVYFCWIMNLLSVLHAFMFANLKTHEERVLYG